MRHSTLSRWIAAAGSIALSFFVTMAPSIAQAPFAGAAPEQPVLPGFAEENVQNPVPNQVVPNAQPPANANPPAGNVPMVGNEAIDALIVESELDANERFERMARIDSLEDMYWLANVFYRDAADMRIKLAIAHEVGLEAWNRTVKEYFNRREANLLGKMKVMDLYQQKADQRMRIRRNEKRRLLQNLFDNPEYAGKPQSSLNFLLKELSDTPIGYGVGLDEYFSNNPSHGRWDLTTEMLDAIRVQTPETKGAQTVFPLSDPVPLRFDWWPPILREPIFHAAISNLENERDALLRLGEQNPNLPIEAINRLEFAHSALTQEFYTHFPPPWKNMTTVRIRELIAVEGHLLQMAREIEAIRDRGTLSAMTQGQYFDPLEDGKNAATLVAWMTRNGMQFAPPRPGDEQAYTHLLTQVKELMVMFGDPLPDPDAPLPRTDQPREVSVPKAQK